MRRHKAKVIVGCVCGVLFAVAHDFVRDWGYPAFGWGLPARAALYAVAFSVVFVAAEVLLGRWAHGRPGKSGRIGRAVDGFARWLFDGPLAMVKLALITFVIWLPALVVLCPGCICFDTVHMVTMYAQGIGSEWFNAHHPVFDTLFIGGIIVNVARLTGSWLAGVLAYALVQGLLTAFAFAYASVSLNRKFGFSRRFSLGVAAVYTLFPLFGLFAFYLTKDSLFSVFFVVFLVKWAEAVKTRGESLRDARSLAAFIIVALLCCATKKVGAYVIVASLVCALPAISKERVRMLCCAVGIALAAFAVMPAVYAGLGIEAAASKRRFRCPSSRRRARLPYTKASCPMTNMRQSTRCSICPRWPNATTR